MPEKKEAHTDALVSNLVTRFFVCVCLNNLLLIFAFVTLFLCNFDFNGHITGELIFVASTFLS